MRSTTRPRAGRIDHQFQAACPGQAAGKINHEIPLHQTKIAADHNGEQRGGVVLLVAAAFVVLEYFSFRQGMQADFSTLAQIVGDQSTAALTYNDPATARENLSTLASKKAGIIAAAIYTNDTVFVSYHSPRQKNFPVPARPTLEGWQFGDGHLAGFQPILLNGERIGTVYRLLRICRSCTEPCCNTPASSWCSLSVPCWRLICWRRGCNAPFCVPFPAWRRRRKRFRRRKIIPSVPSGNPVTNWDSWLMVSTKCSRRSRRVTSPCTASMTTWKNGSRDARWICNSNSTASAC